MNHPNKPADAPSSAWPQIALAIRTALDALGYGTPRCVHGEPESCGGPAAEHAASYLGALRAVTDHHIAHLHDPALQDVAEAVCREVAHVLAGDSMCDHLDHRTTDTTPTGDPT